jgi:hypothetical protein
MPQGRSHKIISIQWIRTSRLLKQNSLCLTSILRCAASLVDGTLHSTQFLMSEVPL